MQAIQLMVKKHRGIIFLTTFMYMGLFSTLLFSQPLAKNSSRFLGGGTSSTIYRNFDQYWNQISLGNDGKWGSVESVQGTYNWTNLDKIYTYATSRNILFKEHAFVWGSQQPGWINSLDSASQRAAVEKWIKTLCERYPLMTYADVVNEPIHAQPSYKNALGGNGSTGWDWVITSFELARKYAASGVKLILNEYNILHDDASTTNYLEIINLLKDRGLIDGIGIQGHYFEFRSHIGAANAYVNSTAAIKANLQKLAATGLPVYITEFDIDESDDTNQLEQYKVYFPIFWNNPAVKGITFWGYIQNDVWSTHPDTYLLYSDGRERSAMQWLREFVLKPIPPVLVSPLYSTSEIRNPALVWNKSENATAYRVQFTSIRGFRTIDLDTVVADTVFQMDSLAARTTYYWRASAINENGEGDLSADAFFTTGDNLVGVDEDYNLPLNFKLSQNYPNPFNPSTTIKFSLPIVETPYMASLHTTLIVYDILGREVAMLVNENKSPGNYEVNFDGKNLPSGVYIYRLRAGNFVDMKKMILLK